MATRDRAKHQALAAELGATWVGDAAAAPPQPLDAAIIFAPAGELVPAALAAVDAGGTVVLGGIHMSDIPPVPYQLLYRERVLRTVANNTRADGHAFLAEAARLGVRTHTELFPFEAANQALAALKRRRDPRRRRAPGRTLNRHGVQGSAIGCPTASGASPTPSTWATVAAVSSVLIAASSGRAARMPGPAMIQGMCRSSGRPFQWT